MPVTSSQSLPFTSRSWTSWRVCRAVFVAVVGLAVSGLVGCSSTDDGGHGIRTKSFFGAFQRDSDAMEDRNDEASERRPARRDPRDATDSTAAAATVAARSRGASSGSLVASPPPSPPPTPTPSPARAAAMARASAPMPTAATSASPPLAAASLVPPPPPEPRIPVALRRHAASAADSETPEPLSVTASETEQPPPPAVAPTIAGLPSDSPEITQLLNDLRQAESIDRDKCDKVLSELRKLDADADPAFYKSMVAFARTVLLPPVAKGTTPPTETTQHATPLATPTAAIAPVAATAAPPRPPSAPRLLAPSTVAIVPPAEQPATPRAEPLAGPLAGPPAEPPTEPSSETRLTIGPPADGAPITAAPVTAPVATPMTAPMATAPFVGTMETVPNAVFVPRGGAAGASGLPAASGAPAIVPVAYQQAGVRDADWQRAVQEAVHLLRSKATTTQDEVRLRLLELAIGNQNEAARTIDGIDPAVRSFWASEMLGLSVLLDERSLPDTSSRHAAAVYHLARAQSELRTGCPLKIQQMKFVEKWYGFGSYTPLSGEFDAGETVSLYLELENVAERESPLGFNSRSSSSYVLLDGAGTVVARVENIASEGNSRSRRRDSCLLIPIAIPKTISPGPYQLKITVTDLNHDKLQYAVEQIPLRIRTYARGGDDM